MHRALAGLLVLLCTGCTPQSVFYVPNQKLYADPTTFGIAYDVIKYPSLNGKTLTAAFMRTDRNPPLGTVVHFHGNYANLSNHFPFSIYLVKSGFDVLIFDYQGYGASQGKPTPKNTVNDGIATVRYAQAHLRNPKSGVVMLAQSLGGAIGIVVAAKEPLVKAAVIEAAFSSYRAMGKDVLQRSVLTWPFSWLTPILLGSTYDPLRFVADISPRPVFFIHGDKDTIVPVHMSKDLFAKAKEPKRLWIVEGANHLDYSLRTNKKYEAEVVEFFTKALTEASPSRRGDSPSRNDAGPGAL